MKHQFLETLNRPDVKNEFDGQIASSFLKQKKGISTVGFF